MGTKTAIEWTDATWNPFQGCTKVDGDCKNCYMYREKIRYGQDPATVVRSSRPTFDGILNRDRYTPGSLVFTASWADWWHPACDAWRADAFDRIDKRRDLTFQIPTKRPERILGTLPESWGAVRDADSGRSRAGGTVVSWRTTTARNRSCSRTSTRRRPRRQG